MQTDVVIVGIVSTEMHGVCVLRYLCVTIHVEFVDPTVAGLSRLPLETKIIYTLDIIFIYTVNQ